MDFRLPTTSVQNEHANLYDAGKVQDLGVDKGLNLERIAMLSPDMVMGYTMNSDYGQFKKVEELNVPVVINCGIFGKASFRQSRVDQIHGALLQQRNSKPIPSFGLSKKTTWKRKPWQRRYTERPTVLSGIVYGDAWFLTRGTKLCRQIVERCRL